MYKFVLDADGAIKLAKAGVLEVLAGSSLCILSRTVYDEGLEALEKIKLDAKEEVYERAKSLLGGK